MRRSRLFRCASGTAVALLIGAIAVPSASADSVGDQRAEVKRVVAELDRMQAKVDQLNEDYVGYLNQKQELDGEIAVSEQKVAEQQAQLGVLQGQLAGVAVDKVMGSGNTTLGPLFTDPVQMDEQLQRDHLARVAVNAGAASTDDYETLLDQLDKETKALEKQQQQAADLAQQAEDTRVKTEAAQSDLQDQLVKEQAKLGDLIAQEQQREADEAAAAYAKQVADAQAKAKADASAAANAKANANSNSNANANSNASGGSSNANTGGGSSGNASGGGGSSSNSNASSDTSGGGGDSSSSDASSSGGGGGGASLPPVS